jgi:hypothetical protein
MRQTGGGDPGALEVERRESGQPRRFRQMSNPSFCCQL